MGKTTKLLDAVRTDAGIVPRRSLGWEQQIADEHRAEVDEIRQAYRDGTLVGHVETLSKVISKHLRERGISTIGHDGVKRWLLSAS